MSRTRFAILCATIGFLSGACASTSPSTESDGTAVVQVEYGGLKPASVEIERDGNIKWVNLVADSRAFVAFPTSISKFFSCGTDLKPYFVPTEGGYQSLPIEPFEPNRVRLPCSLAPGTYVYEVFIMGAGMGEETSIPQRKLTGTIVVK